MSEELKLQNEELKGEIAKWCAKTKELVAREEALLKKESELQLRELRLAVIERERDLYKKMHEDLFTLARMILKYL